ncbi:MAG: very short patch repair endonuclease [Planctomycetota bacterium]
MADTFDAKTRSWIMSRVLSRGTRPEVAVGDALREAGFKFSTKAARLPGNPDFVLRRIKLAVFVNGCFWHWHGCPRSRMPRDNRYYWEKKIARNIRRDRSTKTALREAGWRYWTVWECNLKTGIGRLFGKIRALEAETL